MLNKVIGNTPMMKITCKYLEKPYTVYAKLEMFNLTGSIKDRVVYYMIKKAREEGKLTDGMPIVEVTSGNTGISFSALGAYYNHPVYIFMPDWASEERKKLMEAYGAHLYLVSKEEGGFLECFKKAKDFTSSHHAFYPDQFSNEANILAHYETTGTEIINQLPEKVSGFISGVGTGGTLMGIGKKLKEKFSDLHIGAIEPANMPLISKKEIKGSHKIEGIGDDFVPELLDESFIDDIFLIEDDDAIYMSQQLSLKGIGVGISSGANLLGSILLAAKTNGPVVTIFADDNKKYLSTDLTKKIERPSDLTQKIEIVSIDFV